MIATAVMWLGYSHIHATEAKHGELDESEVWPLYFTFGPILVDAWAYYCLATVVGGL